MVALLVENGAKINALTQEQNTPLHLALEEWLFEIAQFLIDRGASVNKFNLKKETPLHLAAASFSRHRLCQEIIDQLTILYPEATDLPNDQGETPLQILARIKIEMSRDLFAEAREARDAATGSGQQGYRCSVQ